MFILERCHLKFSTITTYRHKKKKRYLEGNTKCPRKQRDSQIVVLRPPLRFLQHEASKSAWLAHAHTRARRNQLIDVTLVKSVWFCFKLEFWTPKQILHKQLAGEDLAINVSIGGNESTVFESGSGASTWGVPTAWEKHKNDADSFHPNAHCCLSVRNRIVHQTKRWYDFCSCQAFIVAANRHLQENLF